MQNCSVKKQAARDPTKILAAYDLLRRLSQIRLPAVITDSDEVDRLRSYAAARLVAVDFGDPGPVTTAVVQTVTTEGLQTIASLPRPGMPRRAAKAWLA